MEREDFDIRDNQLTSRERDFENALRPLSFEDFSGQDKVVDNLRIFVKAARLRGEALDHVLLHGPPGLGKTTLSNIIANELGVGFKVTSGPVLDKPGDLAGVLTSLEPNDVLFIDEIHRLSPVVEEYLYSAMEDYRIDIMIDKGPSARSIQIDLNPFTMVGATTRSGLLTAPLRARFGINLHLEYYDDDEVQILVALAVLLGKAAGDGLLVQRVEDGAARQLRHTGNAGLIGQLVNNDGVNDVAGHAQGIADLTGQNTAQVGGMLALHTGLQVSQQGIADGVGAAGDGLEQAAAAHDDVQGLGVAVFLLQEVQNDLLAEVLLVDDAGVLGDLLGRVAQRFFKQQGLVLEHADLGGGGAGVDDQGFDGHW